MAILGIFNKSNKTGNLVNNVQFKISTELFPYKLYSNRKCYSTLTISITNISDEPLLSSLNFELPSQLSFDETGISHNKEIKLGELSQNELKKINVNIYNNLKADAGNYTMIIIANSHYKDYDHVINSIRKKEIINVE
jgi:uncharacterized membrane protein